MSEVPVTLAKKPLVTASAVGTPPPPSSKSTEDVTFTIDGKEVTAKKGTLIIEAADAAGVYIPRFCYHPRMKPVGMCRMCLVEVEGPRGSTLMPACFNPVGEGMKISTTSDMTKKAQDGVLEFLLVNHPLDCPVCDKGGECPLQDQTMAYGPGESRFVEEKRHWDKPIPISDLVNLDRERCIQCGRCVRFADEVAGDPLIDFYERGDKTEVATFNDSNPFSSYFSGNIVQICPVGALTATPYRFRARPWDLQQVESSCTACSMGCRTAVQTSGDEVVRLLGVDNDPVNWSWLCDKGRFDFQALNSSERLTSPLIRKGDALVETSWAEALSLVADKVGQAKGGASGVAVIGGARLPNEDAWAWSKLARVGFATNDVDAQLGDGLDPEVVLGVPRATIDETAGATVVISLGCDPKQEIPVLHLRLRHAAHNDGLQVVEFSTGRTGLSEFAAVTVNHSPGRLSQALEAVLAGGAGSDVAAAAHAHLERAKSDQAEGPRVVVLLGRPSSAESAESVTEAVVRLREAIPDVKFLSVLRRSNVHGAMDAGLAPGFLPGRVKLDQSSADYYSHHWAAEVPVTGGADSTEILEAAARGRVGALVLLGADPAADYPDAQAALKGLHGARFVVSVDTFLNESNRHADVILPAATWSEREGTFTNLEGRVNTLGSVVVAPGSAWADWVIASELGFRLGVDLGFTSTDDIVAEMAAISPLYAGIDHAHLGDPGGSDGVVVPLGQAQITSRPRWLDPMADPGIASADLHSVPRTALLVSDRSAQAQHQIGAPSDMVEVGQPDPGPQVVGGAEGPASEDAHSAPVEVAATEGGTPAQADDAPPPVPELHKFDANDPNPANSADPEGLRLVIRRVLWDAGTRVAHSPALAGLAPQPTIRLHPHTLADLGLSAGQQVSLSTARGSLTAPVTADPGLTTTTVEVPGNLPGWNPAVLVDSARPVTVVQVAATEQGEAH